MKKPQLPQLCFSPLSGTVYLVTRYRVREGALIAETKFDVTEAFDSIALERAAYKRRGRNRKVIET